MPESRPSRPGSSGDQPPSASRASVPPSEPRPSRASFSGLDAHADRPARLQMIVALILGLVLVAIPLYLWRRPRAESIVASGQDGGLDPDASFASLSPSALPDEKVSVGDVKIVTCHDPGPKKTPPEQCDHLPDLEKALAKAVEENASCVPKDAGGGTIAYHVDVSFKKHGIVVSTPKEGRSMHNPRAVAQCAAVVRAKLGAVSIEAMPHQHLRYKLMVTATYPGPVKP